MARHRLSMGLLLLRLSLGGFMLVWALEKFVNPETTVAIFEYFYMIEINVRWAYILGIPHVALCLMMIAGAYRTVSYGSLMLLHLIGTATTWKKILYAYSRDMGGDHLFVAAVPIAVAFIVLFMLRDGDTRWSIDAIRARKHRLFGN